MERYFVKRTGEDFSETQKIKAEVGHANLVRQAFAKCMREHEVKDGRTFLFALRALLKMLASAGYTKVSDGWNVTGGRFVVFEKMTLQQIFATWASVQQAIAKWIYSLLPCDGALYANLVEQELVFKANDVHAVMRLVFELLYNAGMKLFYVDTEQGINRLETKVLICLSM